MAICHTGPGCAACSLKLIAAITKARPPLFTVYILFKEAVIYSYFTLPYYCLNICYFALWTGSSSLLPLYLMLSSDLDLLSHSHVECAQFIGPVSTNRDASYWIAKSVLIAVQFLFYVVLLMVTPPPCFPELLHPISSLTFFSSVFYRPLCHSPLLSPFLFLSLVSWQSHLSLQLL